MGNCAGIDWAADQHDVLIEDRAGVELLAATFAHDEDGVSGLCAALRCFDVEVVAIERPDGLLVDRLLESGVRVLALHPNQVKASRDRFRASGGKSDRFDRFVLCELARTDRHRFRILEPESDQTKALRALVRGRENLVGTRTALCNQLRAELERFWPGPLGLFADLDSAISLAFLQRYPSPQDARLIGPQRLAGFLKAHRYAGRKTPRELLDRLRAAPGGRAGQAESDARRSVVLGLVGVLGTLNRQIDELEHQISDALDAHPDGEIFRSFFRSRGAVICAATLLCEIGDCRARYPHRDAIAADAGHAPVAVESGKRKNATFRWACNKRLRNALGILAHNSRRWNAWAEDRYAQARARGHNHPRALRTLGRAWSRIIWSCWLHHTPYHPDRHTGLQQHLTLTTPDLSGPRPDPDATNRTAHTQTPASSTT